MSLCNQVKESLAWGRNISREEKEHVLNCPQCSEFSFSFEQLDSLAKKDGVLMSPDFADQVMKKIIESEKPGLQEFLMELFNNTFFRWSIGGAGFLIAFSAH